MLIAQWITDCLADEHHNFTMLRSALSERAKGHRWAPSEQEIRVVLGRLIRSGRVLACQFLAEEQRFGPAVFSDKSIHFYWFRAAGDNPDRTHRQTSPVRA